MAWFFSNSAFDEHLILKTEKYISFMIYLTITKLLCSRPLLDTLGKFVLLYCITNKHHNIHVKPIQCQTSVKRMLLWKSNSLFLFLWTNCRKQVACTKGIIFNIIRVRNNNNTENNLANIYQYIVLKYDWWYISNNFCSLHSYLTNLLFRL